MFDLRSTLPENDVPLKQTCIVTDGLSPSRKVAELSVRLVRSFDVCDHSPSVELHLQSQLYL